MARRCDLQECGAALKHSIERLQVDFDALAFNYQAKRAVQLAELSKRIALAASEENARGHLVITAPTGGSAEGTAEELEGLNLLLQEHCLEQDKHERLK